MADYQDFGGDYYGENEPVGRPWVPEYSVPGPAFAYDPESAYRTQRLGEIAWWPGSTGRGGAGYNAPPAPAPEGINPEIGQPVPEGIDPATGRPFPGRGWGVGGTPPTDTGERPVPGQGSVRGQQQGGGKVKRSIWGLPEYEPGGLYGGPPTDSWSELGRNIANWVSQAWNARPDFFAPGARVNVPPIYNPYTGFASPTGTRAGYSEAEQERKNRLGYNAPPGITGGERVNAQDPRVQAATATVNAKKAAAESALGRPLTPDEEDILWNRTIGPNIGQPAPTGQGGGGRSVGELAFMLNSHQISEPDAYREAWNGGFRGSYRDFLVEKDRIIHQSGVNRGGGGGGFRAPAGESAPRQIYAQPQYAAPSYRGTLGTRRMVI